MPTVLVVADEPDIRQTLGQIYVQGGFSVLEAADCASALTVTAENPFDIVLITLQPTDAALQVCSYLAQAYKAPILYLATLETIDTILNAGASDVILTLHPRLLLYRTQLLLDAHESARQRQLAEALRDTAAMLNSTLEVETVLDRILTLIEGIIPSDLSTMYLIDKVMNEAYPVRTLSTKYPDLIITHGQVRLPVNAIGHLRHMVETKEPLLIPDTLSYPSWVPYPPTQWIRSLMSAPLQVDGQVIGFIFLDSEHPNTFKALDCQTLQIFANQASLAIANARHYETRSQYANEMQQQVWTHSTTLEQKSSQLEAILESIGEGVQGIVFADDMQTPAYSFINSALFDLLGYLNEDMAVLDILRPDDVSENAFQSETAAIFNTVLTTGIWKGERRLKRNDDDGTIVHMGMVVTGLKNSDGRLTGVVSIFRDLSQQKALDAQKARFVGRAAHELRNPISAMKLRLHLLEAQPDRLQNNIANLERIVLLMEHLVEDMLDLTRFENGLISLKDDVTEITSFIRETLLVMESEAEAKNVWLIDRLPYEPVYVSIDQTRMIQVMMNLVSNAVKYTPEDHSVTISVKLGEVGTDTEGYMVMKIIDTGDGIPYQNLPYIFEPFYQVRSGGRGLGLGLAIIKEIVDQHGGHITVESEVGKGTTFTILLKLVDQPESMLEN